MESASPITAAIVWLQGALLGSATTMVAIIAIALFGVLMLSGRIDWRRGVRIVIGCFILFGAPTIAEGLLGAAGAGPGERDAGGFMTTAATAPSAAPAVSPLPYQPSRQPQSICWTCGGD